MSLSDSLFWLAVGMASGALVVGVSIGIEWLLAVCRAALEAWMN